MTAATPAVTATLKRYEQLRAAGAVGRRRRVAAGARGPGAPRGGRVAARPAQRARPGSRPAMPWPDGPAGAAGHADELVGVAGLHGA